MIGLADLRVLDAQSWADATRRFTWPGVDAYSIAADCLRSAPGKTALIAVGPDQTTRITFGELCDLTARLATGLTALGLTPGDRVAVKLAQSVEMAVAVLAVLRAGAVAVPISNVLGEDGVRHRLQDSQPRFVIASGSERDAALATEVDAVLVRTSAVGAGRSMQDLMAQATAASSPMAAASPDTPALLMYTSGTTGKPKGVLHGHRVLLGHHALDLALDHVHDGDVAYSPVDWAWAGGLLLGLLVPLAYGMTVVAHRETRFDVESTIGLFAEHGVSVGLFPPTALRLMRQSGAFTSRVTKGLRLRCLVTGAEAVESDLFDWARADLKVSVNNAFGQTEANALIGHSAALGALDPACLGLAYPGHDVAVLDQSLQPVAVGDPGQIAVRADDAVCMLRYWNAPEATEAKVTGGWLLTGDAAHRDANGRFYFHGRTDDIIKSGGYRLGPAEIEAAILLHPLAIECAVVGLPDPVRGQAVTAYVRLTADGRVSDELTRELQQRVRTGVGAHAYPRAIHYVSDLPRTATGKIDRVALRSQASVLDHDKQESAQ